jgi:hypothetical protein
MGQRLFDYSNKLFMARVDANHKKMAEDITSSEADLSKMLVNSKPDEFNVKMVRLSVEFMKKNLAEGEARHAKYVAKFKPPKQRKFK